MAQDDFSSSFHNVFSWKYQIFFSIFCTLKWKTFFLQQNVLYLYIYIYIFIYPPLSFDLALLCKFSSNTSGTALGRIGSGGGGIKCRVMKLKMFFVRLQWISCGWRVGESVLEEVSLQSNSFWLLCSRGSFIYPGC